MIQTLPWARKTARQELRAVSEFEGLGKGKPKICSDFLHRLTVSVTRLLASYFAGILPTTYCVSCS